MYAFLSKVFGRKKDDKDASSSSHPVLGPGELLGGRFEAISRNVSPTPQLLELDPNTHEAKDKEVEKDVGFSFLKGKWRPASPDVKPSRKLDVLPHLSLNFQEPKTVSATPDIGLLFRTDQILSDAVIGQRRLNPLEALVLVQACSQAIIAKGVDTLGIMHPHWHAASHGIQRRVISHFIYLLNLEGATPISSPVSPASPLSAFEAEVNDTLSPHDTAAILRWGLRHVQLDGNGLGTDDEWYKAFLEAEGAAGYPPRAFSDKLAPLLPTAHLQLLTATLEIFSSLAAHAECNGTSGSKLCKIFGLWLLTAHHVEDKDDWKAFYARWERTGRMLEHLFLSRIRDESTDQRMPIRLLELVRKYPYTKGLSSPTTDLPLLPRPPFTTHSHDAFFVRIEIELPYGKRKPNSKLHPLSLLSDAFSTKVEEGEYTDLWAKIITASKGGDSSSFSNIFADDTIRILSLVPGEPSGHEVRSPTFSLVSPVSPHKRSLSANEADKSEAIVAGHPKSATEFSPMAILSPLNNGIGSDWAQFSASGFLEISPNIIPLASTLLDTDIEKTIPPEPLTPLSRKSSKRSKAASPSSPRKSIDLARSARETSPEAKLEDTEEQRNIIKASQPQIIQLDEAFVDFWSDSLLDPISADWPTFIICKFKSSLVPELTFGVTEEGQKQKTIQWLVLEQVYTIRALPVPPIPVETVRPRPSSPGAQSTSGRKRFSFWSVSRTASGSSSTSHKGKKKDQELRVGEMGELLEEEPGNEVKELMLRLKSPIFKSIKSLDIGRKSVEPTRKSVIKPAEEAKTDEAAAVAAVATGIVVASTTAVIANGLPTDEPNRVEAVTAKETSVVDTKAEIVVPVDVRSKDAALVETSFADEPVEVILPPSVEESPETLAPMVEPSYEKPDDETVGSHITPEVDTIVPETQVLGGAELVPAAEELATPVELNLEQDVVADLLLPSQEPLVAPEAEQPVAREETAHISSNSSPRHEALPTPEANVSIAVESEPEPLSTTVASEDTLEVEAQHVLLSTESRDAPNIELEDEIIPLAADEPGPEAVEAVVAPVSETLELQPQHSVEETTEEVYAAVEAPSETEAEIMIPIEGRSVLATEVDAQLESTATPIPIALSLDDVSASEVEPEQLEEYTTVAASSEPLYEPHSTPENGLISTVEHDTPVEPVEVQLEALPVAEESGGTAEVEPQIIPAIVEESPTQIEEESPVLADLQDDTTLSETAYAEPIEAGPVLVEEEPATIVESEPEALHMATSVPVVPIPASDVDVAVTTQPSEMLEDELNAADILPELELDLPSHDIETEGSSSVEEADSVQDSSASPPSTVDISASEIIHNPADVRTLFTPEFHDTPTAVELETATYTAPDTPRVSAISDNTNTSDSTAETVQLPSTVSHELFTITNESTLIPAEEILNAQSEVQVLEETFNEAKADTGVADVDIVPETTPSAAIDDTNDLTISSTSIISSESPAEFVTVAEETQLLQDDGSLPVTDETVVQADAVESMEEESAARSQLESEMVVLPSSDSDIQDATLNQFEVTAEEIKPSDTELDFTATDVTPSISSTVEVTAPMPSNDSQAQEPEVVTDSLEQSTLFSIAAPIFSGMTILAADVMEVIDEITTIVGPSVQEDDPIGEIPVVTSTIPTESAASAPLHEEYNVQQFEASADSQDSDPIAIDDTQDTSMNSTVESIVIPSHEPTTEGNDISESAEVEGAPINAVIPTAAGETIVSDFEDIALTSDDTSNPEAGLPLSNRSTSPVDIEPNSQDNATITTVGFDTGTTHVDEMPDDVVEDVSAELEPSTIVASTSDFSTNLGGTSETIEHSYALDPPPDAHIDAEPTLLSRQQAPADGSDVADEYERSTTESHLEDVQSDPIMSELTNSTSKEGGQVETAAEVKADSIEELDTEASNIHQDHALSTGTEDLFDSGGSETVPTMEQGAQIETIDPAVQEAPVSEEVEPEETLATVEYFNGHSDINAPSVEPSAEVEPIKESSVEVAPELQADPAVLAIVDELTIIETPVIDNAIEGLGVEPEEDIASDRLEDLEETNRSVETAEFENISESHSQVDLTDVQVLPEATDNRVQDVEEPIDSHVEVEERIEISSTAEPLVSQAVSTVSEPAILVPEDLPIENDDAAQAEEDLVDAPAPTDNTIQEESVVPLEEFKEAVEISSTAELSVAEPLSVVISEPATVVPEDLQIENDGVEEPVEISSTAEPSMAEAASAVSEPATMVPKDLQIENDGIAQVDEDLVEPPALTDNTIQDESIAPLEEFNVVEISSTAEPSAVEPLSVVISEPATVIPDDLHIENDGIEEPIEMSSTAEPSMAEAASAVSEPATVEDLQVENDSITQVDEDLVPTNNPAQKADVPLVEFKETIEIPSADSHVEAEESVVSSTVEPSVAEPASVVSEPATMEPEIENSGTIHAEEDSVDPPPPTNIPVQKEAISTLVESEEVDEISPTAEMPVAETAPVIPEPATVVQEDPRIENVHIVHAEEDFVDSPPTDDPVQEEAVAPLVESEVVQILSITEASEAEIASTVSELATVVPDDLQIENGGITHTEEDFVDPLPPTDDPVQEEPVAPIVESEVVEISSAAQPSVAEIMSAVSEPATVVPELEDLQIKNDGIAQAEEGLVDLSAPPDNTIQEESVAPIVEFKEAVEISSTAELSVAEPLSVVISEPATVIPEDLQIENDGVEEPVETSLTAEPSMAEATSVVSELATVVPEDLQVENDGIPQAEEDLVDLTTPPTNNPVQEEAATLLVESKETVEISSTAEPSVAETLSDVVSELATVVPEDLHIEDGGIPQAEEDFVDSPALTNDPVQEDAVAPIVESEETTAEPSEGETTSVLSELATIVPEELQIENGGIAHAEEDLVDPPRPTDDGHVQEKVVTPLVESKTNEISSTTEPSTPTMATIVSETSMEPPEDLQIENAGVAQADVDPPAPTDPVQDDAVAPLVESKEATAEPSVAETASVVSEPAIPVPEELEIEDVIAQAEEELVDLPLLPTDDPVEEAVVPLVESGKAIEFSSTAETLMTEIASVISELSKEVLEVLSIDSDGDVQEDHSVDLALETVGTEPVREGTEDQAEVAIPETVAVEGMAVETQSFEQSTVEAPETHILNGNGHSAIKEETIETLDDATFAENLTSEDDIKAEPKIMEPIHHISPETLEAPLSTTEYQED